MKIDDRHTRQTNRGGITNRPAGSIPDWISNMIIVDSPIKVMSGLRERVEK